MNGYFVWYRLENDAKDTICGYARNWVRAEQMAENMDLHLRSKQRPVVAVGVKRGAHGQIYEDEEWSLRWSVIPPEPEKE